jgi:hypothetical protein
LLGFIADLGIRAVFGTAAGASSESEE